MSNLIIEVTGNRTFNRTFWVPSILIYDDYILYRNRVFFSVSEISIPYKQVSQVKLFTGLLFAELEIGITGHETTSIKIRYANKKVSRRAKKIIDQKIHIISDNNENLHPQLRSTEKSLARLKILLQKNKISNREYNKRKKEIISGY